MPDFPRIVSVNISRRKGVSKEPAESIEIDDKGIIGDAHRGPWHRQVSLLSQDRIDEWAAEHDRPIKAGEFAENITIAGMSLSEVSCLDQFQIGPVLLEVTQIGKACHGDGCAIYRDVGECIMPKEGLFARVLSGGRVKPGDAAEYKPYTLTAKVITLSDRASAGVYEDRSGPEAETCLQNFFRNTRWRSKIIREIIPDERDRLDESLRLATGQKTDIVITTGSTGVGARDIAPDVIAPLLHKKIPGIMDHIRLKFGAEKPNALLSRSIAGVISNSLVFALPGSVKAVQEYMSEIVKVLEHLIYTLHGIDRH